MCSDEASTRRVLSQVERSKIIYSIDSAVDEALNQGALAAQSGLLLDLLLHLMLDLLLGTLAFILDLRDLLSFLLLNFLGLLLLDFLLWRHGQNLHT